MRSHALPSERMGEPATFVRSPSRLIPRTSKARVRLPSVGSRIESMSFFSASARDIGVSGPLLSCRFPVGLRGVGHPPEGGCSAWKS